MLLLPPQIYLDKIEKRQQLTTAECQKWLAPWMTHLRHFESKMAGVVWAGVTV